VQVCGTWLNLNEKAANARHGERERESQQQLPTDQPASAGQQRRSRAHITTPVSTTQHLNRDHSEEIFNITDIFTFRQVEISIYCLQQNKIARKLANILTCLLENVICFGHSNSFELFALNGH